jgi:hypothetical protein
MEIGDMTAEQFAKHLQRLRVKRRSAMRKTKMKLIVRSGVTPAQRRIIFAKTAGRCHICGGMIDGQWHADHVLAHSTGGAHSVDNYLPSHSVCNNYRWHYSAEEFQLILKLGVMVRTMVEKGVRPGPDIAEAFVKHEGKRIGRTRLARAPRA